MAEEKKHKRTFDAEGFSKFIEEFKNESDRAAVILGAAKLDLLLYQILQQFMAPITGGKDDLLDGDGPLGTFSAKIMLANRLGLIDNEFTRSLQFVRKIRNAFAHEVSGCTLSSGAHRDRVKELVIPLKHKNAFIRVREENFTGKDEPAENFRTALAFMVARLDLLLSHIESIDCSHGLDIFGPAALEMGEVDNPRKIKRARKQRASVKKLTNKSSRT